MSQHNDDATADIAQAILLFVLLIIFALTSCTTTVRRGASYGMQPHDDRVYVEPGGTLIIPADPEAEREHREVMSHWWCRGCDALHERGVERCPCGRTRDQADHGN